MLQSAAYAQERQMSPRFTILNLLGLAASFILLGQSVQISRWQSPAFHGREAATVASHCLVAFQCLVVGVLLLVSMRIPRRPNLTFRGSPVDDQYTVSLIGRLSFAWTSPTLRHARSTMKSLELSDLPVLHNAMRASTLFGRFMSFKSDTALWKKVYHCHRRDIMIHYMLAVFHSAVQLAPQWFMFLLLRCLERKSVKAQSGGSVWSSVAGLGFTVLFAAWLETQILWIVNTKIVICLRSEIVTQIYAKLLAKKDVKQLPHSKAREDGPQADGPKGDVPGSTGGRAKVQESDTGTASALAPQKSHHDAINLVALDTKRVTDFMGASFLIPASITKLAVSMTFLIHLIGWKSVLLGSVALALLNPLNIYMSRLMNAAQSKIMKIRDRKMSLINEALQGIRQIKFTAAETEWLNSIEKQREEELNLQWYMFILRTALVGFWQIGPILFSAVSLAVYATLTGSLSPSIAFTSIAVCAFGSMLLLSCETSVRWSLEQHIKDILP